jgi:AraC-like DNA-binding protein
MTLGVDPVSVTAWKPAVAGVREVLHATFGAHAYPPHTHDTWTLFIVDTGAIRYELDGRDRAAEPSMVSVLPPFVVHDGRPATPDGYRKRVLYLDPAVIGEDLIGRAVDRPTIADPGLRADVDRLHGALVCAEDALEAEIGLGQVVERIRTTLGGGPVERSGPATPAMAEALRAYLDSHLFETVTLASVAMRLGVGPTSLARSFSAAFGISPHAYVTGRRLDVARDRILRGQPLADVAAEVGFVDQAHLTRRFRRFLGTTPGRFGGRARPSPTR